MRTLANLLVTGAYNSDESARLRQAGWRWAACDSCGFSPIYAKDYECLRCRIVRVGRDAPGVLTDAALSESGVPRAGDTNQG